MSTVKLGPPRCEACPALLPTAARYRYVALSCAFVPSSVGDPQAVPSSTFPAMFPAMFGVRNPSAPDAIFDNSMVIRHDPRRVVVGAALIVGAVVGISIVASAR